jgi:hypothetical protein
LKHENHKTRHSYHLKKEDIPKLPTHLIIDCSMFSYIDTNGIKTLKRTIADYGGVGLKILLGGCPSHVTKQLERDHFYAAVPAHHIYISIYDALQHALQQRDAIPVVAEEVEPNEVQLRNGLTNGAVNGIRNVSFDGKYDNFDEIHIDFEPSNKEREQKETTFTIG